MYTVYYLHIIQFLLQHSSASKAEQQMSHTAIVRGA